MKTKHHQKDNYHYYLMFAGSEERGSFYLLGSEGQCIANIPPGKITKEVVDYLSMWIVDPKKTGVITKDIQVFNTLNQILLKFLDKKKDNFAYGLRGNWIYLFEQIESPLSKRIARKSLGIYSEKIHRDYSIESELFDMHQLFLLWKRSKSVYLDTVQSLKTKEKNYITSLEDKELLIEMEIAFPGAVVESTVFLSEKPNTYQIVDKELQLGEGDTLKDAFIHALQHKQKQTTFF